MTLKAAILAAGFTLLGTINTITGGIGVVGPAQAQVNVGRREVVIATATPTGNYFTIGNALCRVLQRQGLYLESGDVTLLDCGASASSGSIQNVELLRSRTVDFALVQSDVVFNAYNGSGRFEGRRVDQLRSLLSLNQEAFQVLAGRGANVANWAGLKGKKVNLGPPGTTPHVMFRELLDVHGLDEKWLGRPFTIPVNLHIQELCEGNIEVLGQATGVPNSGLATAIRRCGANLVALDTPEVRKYVAERPYYTETIIPRDTYAGQTADIRTFGVLATLMATTDTSEISAYSIVRAVFEGLPELKAMQPVLRELIPAQMIKDGLTAPLHPGAERYFRERGWIKVEPPKPAVSFTSAIDALAAAAATPEVARAAAPAAAAPAVTPPAVAAPAARGKATRGKSQAKGRGAAGST